MRINPSNKSIQVPVKSFNEEVYKINPTFLILDIEGGEYDLLQFADFHTIKKIVIELHPHFFGQEKLDFVISRLKDAGFNVNKKLSFTKQLLLQRD
ncbi:MAG: FkbM family methyltransferase [Okeania sp. SIO3I5]|nr:FkbM family methyltransferase [Okeania sp. SIO3I5]